jgi:hypothetical protein
MSDKVLVRYEEQDKIAVLTLDDPPANTYTHEMMAQLDAAIVPASQTTSKSSSSPVPERSSSAREPTSGCSTR